MSEAEKEDKGDGTNGGYRETVLTVSGMMLKWKRFLRMEKAFRQRLFPEEDVSLN